MLITVFPIFLYLLGIEIRIDIVDFTWSLWHRFYFFLSFFLWFGLTCVSGVSFLVIFNMNYYTIITNGN